MIRGIYQNAAGEWFVDEQFITFDAEGNSSMSALKTRPATADEVTLVMGVASEPIPQQPDVKPNQSSE